MPRIMLQAPNGEVFRCESGDVRLLGQWMTEILGTYSPGFGPYDRWQVQVQPLFGPPGIHGTRSQPDWGVNSALPGLAPMTFQNSLDGLIATLAKLRAQVFGDGAPDVREVN